MAGALEGALGRTPQAGAPTPPSIPPQPLPVGAGAGGGRIGGIPSWLFFGGLGVVAMAAITLVAAMILGGNGGDLVQLAVPPPTAEPTLASVPTSIVDPPTATPVPSQTPSPTYTPYPTPIPTPRPTPTPHAYSYYNKGIDYSNLSPLEIRQAYKEKEIDKSTAYTALGGNKYGSFPGSFAQQLLEGKITSQNPGLLGIISRGPFEQFNISDEMKDIAHVN